MYDVFERLINERNITAYKVSKATGISTATLSQWKNGTSTPKQDKLKKIADYLGVNVAELIDNNAMAFSDATSAYFKSVYNTNKELYIRIISTICKMARINKDLTERFVAESSCITTENYINFENGVFVPDDNDMLKIMETLSVNTALIIGFLSAFMLLDTDSEFEINKLSNAFMESNLSLNNMLYKTTK